MIQLYDDALHDHLKENFKGDVTIVPVANYWDTIAMHKEGRLQLPAIVLFRANSTRDIQLRSWTIGRKGRIDRIRNHKKVSEQAIPIQIDYTATLLATTQDDIDELTSEIVFLFLNKPRLTIPLPYGSDRFLHGQITPNGDWSNGSANDRFSETGILYQEIIPIRILGANIINIREKNLRYLQWSVDSNLAETIKEEIDNAKN
jgi:hypothetical protein